MTERDPRIDPQVGDRFGKNGSGATIVRCCEGSFGFTFCGRTSDSPPMPNWNDPWLPEFREWAKNAEVIQDGDTPETEEWKR